MKNILLLSIIAISLSACGSQTDTKLKENTENEKQIAESEVSPEKTDDEEIKRTYPEDDKKEEEIKKEVIDVENSDRKSVCRERV